jgi:drug/metabolite transporter (DMT)-like permease
MREISNHFDAADKLLMFLGTAVGAAVTLVAIERLSPEQAALVSALLIAALAFAASELSNPRRWWLCVGMIAGILVGMASVLSETIADNRQPLDFEIRSLIAGLQAMAGFVVGFVWGRKTPRANIPPLKTFLSRLGAITAGLYAVVVTLDFLLEGLEEARTLSSRLSTTTTILITMLIIPAIIGYLLAEFRKR